jgi:hypothetical protein
MILALVVPSGTTQGYFHPISHLELTNNAKGNKL